MSWKGAGEGKFLDKSKYPNIHAIFLISGMKDCVHSEGSHKGE